MKKIERIPKNIDTNPKKTMKTATNSRIGMISWILSLCAVALMVESSSVIIPRTMPKTINPMAICTYDSKIVINAQISPKKMPMKRIASAMSPIESKKVSEAMLLNLIIG
ncbi:MAG: hypothetical protein GX097_08860 [Methanomicrobiales archaeon]|jgi:hypothetical protein|nr:hypothetical protein [Methanomicrobiales archaeon]